MTEKSERDVGEILIVRDGDFERDERLIFLMVWGMSVMTLVEVPG